MAPNKRRRESAAATAGDTKRCRFSTEDVLVRIKNMFRADPDVVTFSSSLREVKRVVTLPSTDEANPEVYETTGLIMADMDLHLHQYCDVIDKCSAASKLILMRALLVELAEGIDVILPSTDGQISINLARDCERVIKNFSPQMMMEKRKVCFKPRNEVYFRSIGVPNNSQLSIFAKLTWVAGGVVIVTINIAKRKMQMVSWGQFGTTEISVHTPNSFNAYNPNRGEGDEDIWGVSYSRHSLDAERQVLMKTTEYKYLQCQKDAFKAMGKEETEDLKM